MPATPTEDAAASGVRRLRRRRISTMAMMTSAMPRRKSHGTYQTVASPAAVTSAPLTSVAWNSTRTCAWLNAGTLSHCCTSVTVSPGRISGAFARVGCAIVWPNRPVILRAWSALMRVLPVLTTV
ncbi:MAG: hypothetical protein U0S36_14065 [Candidatus Nanopelagicales bacterium]